MNGDFSWNRILFNSRAYARRVFVPGSGTYRQVAELQDRRVVLMVSAWPINTAPADAWIKADDTAKSDGDNTNYGINLLHQIAGPVSLDGATITPTVAGAIAFPNFSHSIGAGPSNDPYSALTITGTVDPVTGAVAETVVSDALAFFYLLGSTEPNGNGSYTGPTFTLAAAGGEGTTTIKQRDFRLALDKDGPSVRLPWFAAATGSGAWLHIVECHCSLEDIEQFAQNPY